MSALNIVRCNEKSSYMMKQMYTYIWTESKCIAGLTIDFPYH